MKIYGIYQLIKKHNQKEFKSVIDFLKKQGITLLTNNEQTKIDY